MIVDETPFYPQGGGQDGDNGLIFDNESFNNTGNGNLNCIAFITDTVKKVDSIIAHKIKTTESGIRVGQNVYLRLDKENRFARAHPYRKRRPCTEVPEGLAIPFPGPYVHNLQHVRQGSRYRTALPYTRFGAARAVTKPRN